MVLQFFLTFLVLLKTKNEELGSFFSISVLLSPKPKKPSFFDEIGSLANFQRLDLFTQEMKFFLFRTGRQDSLKEIFLNAAQGCAKKEYFSTTWPKKIPIFEQDFWLLKVGKIAVFLKKSKFLIGWDRAAHNFQKSATNATKAEVIQRTWKGWMQGNITFFSQKRKIFGGWDISFPESATNL